MRGSIVGLTLDSSLHALALLYSLTLESIALQTRHIIDSMNTAGHDITSIYLSGGQAKNRRLMQLFADVCGMPVVLPGRKDIKGGGGLGDGGDAVGRGAAMLGRFADEIANGTGEKSEEEQGEGLWKIMVCIIFFLCL